MGPVAPVPRSFPVTSPPPEPRRTRQRKNRFKTVVVLLLLPLVLAFGAGEVWVRANKTDIDLLSITGQRPGKNPMSPWAVVDAFGAYRGRPGFDKPAWGKSINSEGFISTPDLTVAKDPGTLRVVFLGGSSTAGQGGDLADSDTWPWQVAEGLRAARPGQTIEFLNAGLGGYSTFESMGRLWARVRFFEPDVLVLCHGWNELYYWKSSQMDDPTTWRRLAHGGWGFDGYMPKNPPLSPWFIDGLIQWSQLLTRARLHLSPRVTGEAGAGALGGSGLRDHYDPRGADVWRTHLRLISATAEVIGAELFVAKQPTLIVPDLAEDLREICQYSHHGFDHDAHVDAFDHLYRVIDETTAEDRVIDLTGLSGRGDLFSDHVHPNPKGAGLIAELVTEALLKQSEVFGPR
ncbi:MAG: lysophospholipase L1-like esterase [Pseudohongiellaceae bacterium]|jgi:lysophospholipase L1-like esterase